MPNTLAHMAAQGLLSRWGLSGAHPRWILLGCVLPDLPWIANRALLIAFPGIVDPHGLLLYIIAQASLLCSLLLCGAFAALAARWQPVFLVLSVNAVLHLLLDASQTKWGNGVHLLAPWSWHDWNLELFWPESSLTYALTGLGLGVGLWALRACYRDPIARVSPSPRRIATAAVLLAAYLVLPALWSDGPERADSHSVRTLHERDARAGRRAALDRTQLQLRDGRAFVLLGGEEVTLIGERLDHPARISVRGRFVDAHHFRVEEIHEHRFPRDLASYIGLGLVAASWAAGLLPRRPAAGSHD